MTKRLVLRKHSDPQPDDCGVEIIGEYEGDTARAAQTAAIEAHERLRQAAFDGELELAAPPVSSVKFEARTFKLS